MSNHTTPKSLWRKSVQSMSFLLLATTLLTGLPLYAAPNPQTVDESPTPSPEDNPAGENVSEARVDAAHKVFLPLVEQEENEVASAAQQATCLTPQQTYGRMFANLTKATWNSSDLNLLADKIMADEEVDPTPEGQIDDEENGDIDAGYTYVGQFIDHDLTLDDRPNDLTTPIDPATIKNFRTPTFDLDSLYGSGPLSSTQLYEADAMHLKLGSTLQGSSDSRAADLPRSANGQAIVADPRNDENRIVGQLHTVFIRFHNKMVDFVRQTKPELPPNQVFRQAKDLVLWHYQWAVVTDFLPTIVKPNIVQTVVRSKPAPNSPPGSPPIWQTTLRFYNPCMNMPVEFSTAAYRFGHSMVRNLYRLNGSMTNRLPVFTTNFDPNLNLAGFSPAPSNFAIDWKFFFQMQPMRQIGIPQTAYKMDASLAFPLSLLPLPTTGTGPADLAQRNLLRGVQLGLPSGQAVARAMGLRPLADSQILIGKATGDAADAQVITSVSAAFAGKAPLWVYIEAETTAHAYRIQNGSIVGAQVAPFRLGEVGGRIVVETMVGLLKADATSMLNVPFRPLPHLSANGKFGFKELIRAATAN